MKKRTRNIIVISLLGLLVLAAAFYYLFPGLLLQGALRSARRAAGLEAYSIQVQDHRIAYLSGGKGEPLVLLHGFGANKDNWPRMAKFLTPSFRVIAPDLPGFGDSSRIATARYSVDDQVERVRAFVKALDLPAFHLGGNSMGGNIAGAYAARYTSEVKTLWLLAPAGVYSAKPSELMGRLKKGENPLIVDSIEGYERLLDFVFYKRPYIPGTVKKTLTQQAIANRDFNAKVFSDLGSRPAPLDKRLKGVAVPTLILWGDSDRLLHVSGAAILESIMPAAKAVVMERTGHLPRVEKPEQSARYFLDFHAKNAP